MGNTQNAVYRKRQRCPQFHCYAKSLDQGKSWEKSTGEKYRLPINVKSAEVAEKIPQGRELINQTSMCTDSQGHPYMAFYWTPEGSRIPHYFLVYFDGTMWKTQQISDRRTAFSLRGTGTKKNSISRPQIMVDAEDILYLIYRNIERGSRVSIAACVDLEKNDWMVEDLTSFSVGQWEPTYDTELWKLSSILHLFVQHVGQGDEENPENVKPTQISVLEWQYRK